MLGYIKRKPAAKTPRLNLRRELKLNFKSKLKPKLKPNLKSKLKSKLKSRFKSKQSFCELAFAVFLLAAAAGTLAYFTYWKSLKNVLSVGYNEIEIIEKYDPPQELKEGTNSYTKRIQIKNTGNVSCYLRAAVKFSDSDITEISEISPDGIHYYAASEYTSYLPDNWIYVPEEEDDLLGGFYYYIKDLAPGSQSEPLLEKIKTTFSKPEDVCAYEIFVYGESVQTLDKNGQEFTGSEPYLEAWREFLQPSSSGNTAELSRSPIPSSLHFSSRPFSSSSSLLPYRADKLFSAADGFV